MTVLNRPMFRRPSALPPLRGPMPVVRETYPVVKREDGTPPQGEISKFIFGEVPESTSSQEEYDRNFYRDKGYDDTEIDLIFKKLLNPLEIEPGEFSLNFDLEAAVMEGKLIKRAEGSPPEGEKNTIKETLFEAIQNLLSSPSFLSEFDKTHTYPTEPRSAKEILFSDPNSVVREGEQAYDPNYGLTDEEIELINLQVTRSGEAENRWEDVLREKNFRNVNTDELRFRQTGSPPMGEQVNAENVGIMDGFNEGQAATMMAEGEAARQEIDSSETYDELMKSTRGDNLSEADRRKELAAYVGEEDAEQTPDSVLALLQPVMQMLNTETANVGIAQVEDGSLEMPTEPVGIAQGGIVGYAMGGAVRKIPKYANGTGSSGVSVEEEQGFGFTSNESQYPNTILDLFTEEDFGDYFSTGDTEVSPVRTKYDANYKLFSEILGGTQSSSKDLIIGDILTTVVAPLAFAYAQGEDINTVLGQGSKMVGEKALAYDKIKKQEEAQIKNLALQQAMKKDEVNLMEVNLRDDPDTPNVDESLEKVWRKQSEVIENPDLYTVESISKVTADVEKVKGETAKLNIETAIKEIEFEYANILKDLEVEDKQALVEGRLITNTINQAIANNKPELLAAELKNINLNNVEKGIRNDTLRPTLEAELEKSLIDIDIATEDLKQEIVTTKHAAKLEGLKGEELQAKINLLVQEEDFNEENNVLLLEEKAAEINNLILTGKNLDLENEYQELENLFKTETMDADIQAKMLENTQKRLENVKLSIENEYLPEEKKLGIDKIKLDMEKLNEVIQGQVLENQTKILDLNNYNEKTFLEFEKQKLEIRKLQYELDNPKKDWEEIKIQTEYMNKWNNSPITTMMREKQGFMQNLISNAGENTGAGDLSFIFQYMKMLDPRSVVREGEFETAKKTGGIPASVWAAYEGIKSGKLLSPSVKADFLSAAGKMYLQEVENYNKERATYLDIAAQNGLKAELAVPSIAFDTDLIEQITNANKINDFIKSFELQESTLPIEEGSNLSLGKIRIPSLENE